MRFKWGIDEFACSRCHEETEDFVNDRPPCFSGMCKELRPRFVGKEDEAPKGSLFRNSVGIGDFLSLADTITSLCPNDASGFATAPPSEVKSMIEVKDFDFWWMLAFYLSKLNGFIAEERKKNAKA